jgi:glycosyltransferase involved in cell wall biosynthesis
MYDKKLISVVSPCYNEQLNVEELYKQVKEVFAELPQYRYEHIFIDNASTDNTVVILKKMATNDHNIKIIVNIKNFGHIRSPYYGLLQAHGDAVVLMASDLQDPPATIKQFIHKWEEGNSIVVGVKNQSEENALMFAVRKIYYNLIRKLSDIEQIKNFTGFGLYDQKFIEVLRKLKDPYPYFRGLITEVGFNRAEITYVQPARKRGKTSNNFYSLYDLAMLGFVNHSKIPLRLASFIGFGMSVISFTIGIIYLVYKLLFWDRFEAGLAPLTIGIFLFSSIQLFFIGILGEYIGAIYTQVRERPLVIEKERVNF